jgi:hypothetical protein
MKQMLGYIHLNKMMSQEFKDVATLNDGVGNLRGRLATAIDAEIFSSRSKQVINKLAALFPLEWKIKANLSSINFQYLKSNVGFIIVRFVFSHPQYRG